MKTLACMTLGYQMVAIFLSEILGPVASIVSLAIAFFIPHITRKQFLCLAAFQSLVITVWIIVRRDVLRPFLFNIDYFAWIGLTILLLVFLLFRTDLTFLGISSLDSPILKILGAFGFFWITLFSNLLVCFLNLLLIRILRLREKVGKLYPEKWWKWKN